MGHVTCLIQVSPLNRDKRCLGLFGFSLMFVFSRSPLSPVGFGELIWYMQQP